VFCRNCGEVLIDTDVYCLNCGFAVGDGDKYCASCGSETLPGALVCDICGCSVSNLTDDCGMQFQQAPSYQDPPQYRQAAPPPFQGMGGFPQQVFRQRGTPGPMMQQANTYVPPNTYNVDPAGQQYFPGYTYKSRVTAGVLGIVLGALGVHNFYQGKTGPGLTQLLLTVCSCGILSPISALWGFIEGILLLTGAIDKDGNGLPLK